MDYTFEEIYYLVGREDKTSTLFFKNGSPSFKNYSEYITVLFIYTQAEREEMDKKIQIKPFSLTGYLKVKPLGLELSREIKEKIDKEGINSEDIAKIIYYNRPSGNTFHSKEKRTITKINVPMTMMSKGRDFDWMYGLKKRLVKKNIGLCPNERSFYLAAKYYYEPEELNKEELKEIFIKDNLMVAEIEWELLYIKRMREEITDEEKKKSNELFIERKTKRLAILDKYLIEAGSSFNKLSEKSIDQAVEMQIKVMRFKERRLNVIGETPIYIDLDSYLHIYMRHVEEMKVNKHFEHKDNFQWNEEDVFTVMGKVIEEINEDIQKHFKEKQEKKYMRFGKESKYFEGDYYTFHIDTSGRIETFYKNRKEHER